MKRHYIIHLFVIFLLLGTGVFTFSHNIMAECSPYALKRTNSFGFIWGKVTIEGLGDVPVGAEIRAYVDEEDICYGSFKINKQGFYGAMTIYMDDPTTPEKDGVKNGDILNFKICLDNTEYNCNETYRWNSSNINNQIQLDLTGKDIVSDAPEQ